MLRASAVLVLAAYGCGTAPAAAPHMSNADSAVYIAVVDSLRASSSAGVAPQVFVARARVRHIRWGAAADSLVARLAGEFQGVPAAVIAQLVPPDSTTVDLARVVGPLQGATWADSAGQDSLARVVEQGTGEPAHEIISLSRIAYTVDRRHAVLYATLWCGFLCGHGSFFWLTRDDAGRWHVREESMQWIS